VAVDNGYNALTWQRQAQASLFLGYLAFVLVAYGSGAGCYAASGGLRRAKPSCRW
jgi:hypothetical protein